MSSLFHILASLVLTWYGAAILGGLLVFAAERHSRRRPPSDIEVAAIARRYRDHYGNAAPAVLADHIRGVSLWGGRAQHELLHRVAGHLRRIESEAHAPPAA